MAQSYTTGACGIFLGVGSGNGALFLGHCEAGVHINTIYAYDPVMNDLTGTQLPYDEQIMGEEAYISGIGPFTRWNEITVFTMEQRMTGSNPLTRGTEGFGNRGSFVSSEGLAFQVWLVFPYSVKTFFRNAANGALEAGRRYVNCEPVDNQEDTGTRHKRRHISFRAKSVPAVPALTHGLYDASIAGLPAIN